MGKLNAGDFSAFHQSPDYQFALDQGMKTLDRSAAARGRLDSGGYGMDLVKYGQGMAEQNYSNYYDRLARMAGEGQGTAQNLGALGQNMANSIGNSYRDMGAARASGYQQRADTNSQLAGSLGNLFGQYWGKGGSGGWGGI